MTIVNIISPPSQVKNCMKHSLELAKKNYRKMRKIVFYVLSREFRIIIRTITKNKFKGNETKTAQLNEFHTNMCVCVFRHVLQEKENAHTIVNCCR